MCLRSGGDRLSETVSNLFFIFIIFNDTHTTLFIND